MKKDQKRMRRINITGMSKNVKKSWANGMSAIFNRLSIKTQKWLFFLVFLGTAAYCFSLLMGNGSGGLPDIGKIKNIHLPDMKTTNTDKSNPEINIKKLKQYLDNLSVTQRDSFLLSHPGILDSIQKWEKQLSTLKNK